MSENMGGSSRKRKILSIVLAVSMAATMLLSGTLAYYYSAKATNILENAKKEVIGHDDLFQVSAGEYNKDVYAENTGNKRVFVRIRLTETLTVNGTVIGVPGQVIHTLEQEADEDGTTKTVVKHKGSNTTDGVVSYYEIPRGDQIHDYFELKMGSDAGKYFLSKKSDKYSTSANSDLYLEKEKVAHDDTGKVFTAEDAAAEPKAILQAPAAGIITMAEYQAKKGDPGAVPAQEDTRLDYTGWVIDESGWAYWSQPLYPGQATGLLLDQVIVKEPKTLANTDYEYKINVVYQAVDDDDIGIWTANQTQDAEGNTVSAEQATADAKEMLLHMQANAATEEYSAKVVQLRNEINEAIQALPANHSATLSLYDYALTFLGTTANSNIMNANLYEVRYRRAVEAKKAAEELEQKIADGTVSLTRALTLDANMDTAVKDYILETYGGEDGKLSEAEAYAVTKVEVEGITKLDGVSQTTFKNLKRLQLNNPKMASITIGTELSALRELIIAENKPSVNADGNETFKVTSIDFREAEETIEDLLIIAPKLTQLNGEAGVTFTGKAKLVYFDYAGPVLTAIDTSASVNMNHFSLKLLKVETNEGEKTVEKSVIDYETAMPFNTTGLTLHCTGLNDFYLYGGFTADGDAASKVIDLSAVNDLRMLIIQQGSTAVTCKLKDDHVQLGTAPSVSAGVTFDPAAPTVRK